MKSYKFKVNENGYTVNIKSHEDNIINLEVNGTSYDVIMKSDVKTTKTPTLVRSASKHPAVPLDVKPKSTTSKIVAPIPGVILSLNVQVGDVIKENDQLLVLEAMKMENNIVAEKAGTVTAIKVTVGQQVLQDAVMIEFE
ncbi:acetyl-CoA carboxylase biotin carboxyl carrier protein subunit [Winogradskyella undariae]|uniref:biotin/lipoyl-containing protein n=1 Tax=Winogradskyella TaxID=286104 RepID=UPI00156AE893|nr:MULTISPECIES: biotin/lipoyl-containing protein [Winogradskyella]NRR92955.1 acetyl-CoA carboxylase biotin carboxyl carrier protein subunit [Winogradskyella undariae]QNK77724.1 acetyl-CoA carboxylase biotin carboxyl carrier protein subunit [Winogradskyella sp. PAMC22761]QXP79227.1 acetyl-CoA carboxylase biotin carboxyl carrier protein subunit [Winogradskyella sp. HaHa_3_26]